jgi:hypothetical protein
VNDTTSKPDEPEGRGRVATGEQPVVPPQAGASDSAVPSDGADPAPDGSAANTETAESSTEPGSAGLDAATAQLKVPANGSAPQPAPETPAEVPVNPAPEGQVRPSPAPRITEPEPAPGPVPGPGPDAGAPPPWHRMPGSQVAAEPAPQPGSEPQTDRLVDEGPTAFLEPPAPEGPAGEAKPKPSASGSWATVRAVRSRPPRQAALQLKRLDPWSALKLGLVLAVVLFFIWMVAVGVLYGALDGMGVWDRLNGTYADLVSGEGATGSPLISAGRVFGGAAVIGAINSLLFAVAVTIGAFVYNVSADLVGGIEVTLSERD